ncbi:type II toxin-antitoxin system VapC family toxin [Haloechinothrix salitolerans]|uniref:Type II toxin-antitoxin system VapC family toxin n=1 Tax=Haloechinothrix salitolerans TaxID=926830 RepID=A0ABW2C000_9PSEU
MIVYADSSVLARAYLADEPGHDNARALLDDPETVLVTGSWSRIEVPGALVRAAKAHRGLRDDLLALWFADIDHDSGPITVLTANQDDVERTALRIVLDYGIRAMDAWHIAAATLTVPELAAEEDYGFATRDRAQADVAAAYGFRAVL